MSLLLIVGFVVLEVTGLTIETHDRIVFDDRLSEHRGLVRAMMIYRTVAEEQRDERADEAERLDLPDNVIVRLAPGPDDDMNTRLSWKAFQKLLFASQDKDERPIPGGGPMSRMHDGPFSFPSGPPAHPDSPPFHPDEDSPVMGGHDSLPLWPLPGPGAGPGPPGFADGRMSPGGFCLPPPNGPRPFHSFLFPAPPQNVAMLPTRRRRARGIAFQIPDDTRWLVVRYKLPSPNPFDSPTFPLALGLMTAGAGLLIVWGVRRLLIPVRTLSAAAAAFAPEAASPPLSEEGPLEVAQAAAAFNAMAQRIRRFIFERTRILSAIGHDLRTPITRMKLRAEFIEDDEMREKFLADLNELTAIVEATLEFGKDSSPNEKMTWLDLKALLQTVVDDVSESRPEDADNIVLLDYPKAVVVYGRPIALKRAFTNLIINALTYGGNALVSIHPTANKHLTVTIEDEGAGIPEEDQERMFEAFVRGEESRNRETGGTGLGLAITRTIIRGQGGDVILQNRVPHGLRAIVTLLAVRA
ncbi:sensor histidine kinase [Acetobacter conturbans]|nr:HAMP domain-containing sensor histidine kinase [Acetobacter conturbans]